MWETLSEQEKASWLEEASTTGSCGACQQKGRRKSNLSSAGKKASLTIKKRNRKRWREKQREQKECISPAERTIQVIVEARQYENGSERQSRFMLGSQRSHCHDHKRSGFVDSSEGVGQKRQMSSTSDRYWAGMLDSHRDRQIRQQRKVGPSRTRRGRSSSNCPELAAFVMALCGTAITTPMLYVCGNQALLKVWKERSR